MLVVFSSFLLFFGLLLWYADKNNKSITSEHIDHKHQTSRRETLGDLHYYDADGSQFPLNFPKTSPRSLGYTANKAGK